MRGKQLGLLVLGDRLRRLREAAGLSQLAAARAVEKSTDASVRHWEAGSRLIPELELRELAKFYGCTPEQLAELRKLRERAKQPSEFASFGLPEEVTTYLDMERAASEIRTFENVVIPGMLQAEPYMRRLFQLAHQQPSVIDSRVQARLKRQERLRPSKDAPDPVQLIAVIGEEALLRCAREPGIGATQLNKLIEFADQGNIEIRILDLDLGTHVGMDGSFTHLTFANEMAGFVYEETTGRVQLTNKPSTVRYLVTLFDELRSQALDPTKSLTLIAQLAKQGGHAT